MSPAAAVVVLPLISAVIYTFSALMVKKAGSYGLGVWRIAFVTNQIVALVFSALWFFGGQIPDANLLWQPLLVGFLLALGQTLQFLALDRGDITVAVPVFGLKVVLVAFFTTLLLTETVTPKMWWAAVLSVLAVTCLNKRDRSTPSRNIGITLLAGGGGAVTFALFDVLVQKWTPAWGVGRFLPIVFWVSGALSWLMIPMFRAPLSAVPKAAWRMLLPSAALLGVQSLIFICAFAIYGKATVANIAYSSRGLWSVALVWMIGHWFSNDEQHLPPAVLRWRLIGAMLLMSAIALVL